MNKTLDGTHGIKTLFPSIVYELIVNENNLIVNNIIELRSFLEKFKNYLIFNGFTNVEQVNMCTFKYKYNNKTVTFYEKEYCYG